MVFQPNHSKNDDIERADLQAPESQNAFMDDDRMLLQALDSVGASAYGIVAISIWILNEGSSHLVQPRNGFWVDPIFRRENKSDAMEMLLDERRMDYAPARPLIPGEGLEGLLFSECVNAVRVCRSSVFQQHNIKRLSIERIHASTPLSYNFPTGGLVFRPLKPILEDEDQPYNRRISLMVEAKIGKALGLPFHHNSTKGIIVYMARQTAREEDLLSPVCVRYLLNATQFITGLLIFLSSRRESQIQIHERLNGIYSRIRRKMMAVRNMKNRPCPNTKSMDYSNKISTGKAHKHGWITHLFWFQSDWMGKVLERIVTYGQKCKGGNGTQVSYSLNWCIFLSFIIQWPFLFRWESPITPTKIMVLSEVHIFRCFYPALYFILG